MIKYTTYNFVYISFFLLLPWLILSSYATMPRKLANENYENKSQPLILTDHGGPLLKENIAVNLIWYGNFTIIQRSIIVDFINSLSSNSVKSRQSVSSWWNIIRRYRGGPRNIALGEQRVSEELFLGKLLSASQIVDLSSLIRNKNAINIVLTSAEVDTNDFCLFTCGFHGYDSSSDDKSTDFPYIWVGNGVKLCPSICAYNFNEPGVGSDYWVFKAPNNDVGVDSMIIELATALVGAVTNPFDNGYFSNEGLEAVGVCSNSSDLYPGFPSKVLVDPITKGSFNSYGVNGRKYLLPAMWDPQTYSCRTHL